MKKLGQVWIETVLYTLIVISLIGLALAFVYPKVNQSQDKAAIEQSISILKDLDLKINEVASSSVGNKRTVNNFFMKKGSLIINSSGDNIKLTIKDVRVTYSEPGVDVPFGNLVVKTVKGQKTNTVYLILKYNINITYKNEDQIKEFSASPRPYKFLINNIGNKISIEDIN